MTDIDLARAQRIAKDLGGRAESTGQNVIAAKDVNAVIVTSIGSTHEGYVLAAIAAGKPVFCEKPLATTAAACKRILDAEVAWGKRLVQVGFMRRYDAGYRLLKEVVTEGVIGAPLIVHRNPGVQKQLGSRILLSIDPNPTRAEQSLERAKGNERKIRDVKQRYSLAKGLESLG